MIFSSQMLPFITCQWRLLVESLYLNRYVYLVVNQNVCCFLLIRQRNFFLRLFRVNRSVGGANRHVKQHVTYMARTWRVLS